MVGTYLAMAALCIRSRLEMHGGACLHLKLLTLNCLEEELDDSSCKQYACLTPKKKTATVDVEDEETLEITQMTAYYDSIPEDADEETTVPVSFLEAMAFFEENGVEEPDPADYGKWVRGVPVVVEDWLSSANTAEWLNSLILDGIVAGIGAVLGFVPQMLVLFLLLAFLEDCGYMARIAFILDRIFRKFGLSGKSFIPMLVGTGCSVPGIMASRTIENERDRKMTIITTSFIPCSAKIPLLQWCGRNIQAVGLPRSSILWVWQL